ncbi:LOW QUALITY PROTEIN: spermatogenesis-associated protein 31A6-like [Grammomys surdaster]|uniref:LOW QUALITY PROTEIN: spermatogenesis-associated protein 31A6-like n=1 Tax=Grammomys surdaster TaxID=491861 RepID=UPI00109F0719|nr:LOW QUALITY PROTEIN: spermatogenesis-associated protein 31A6-like [Grammomys surdaster]
MESILLLVNSINDLWKFPSSMSMIVDMSFAFLCGVGLFYLLIPFSKDYPESPPSERERNIPKVLKRGHSKPRKKTTTAKCFRNSQRNVQVTQNASGPMERPIQHPLLHSSLGPFWYSKEKLNQLSLPQLFSYLKVLEVLIQQKFNQIIWGISTVLSESVVATAWVSKKSSGGRKSVRFSEPSDSTEDLSLTQEPPKLCQDQSLPNQRVTPRLVGVTGVQELKNLPSSVTNQTPSSFQRRARRRTCPTTEVGIQVSLPNVNELCQQELHWNDIADCNVQKSQTDISQPNDNMFRGTLPTKTIRSASILPEHYQMVYHHEEPQHEGKAINGGEQQGAHVRVFPSSELTELQGDSQPNSDGYCKNLPELNQPAQPSMLISKSYECSQMAGSMPTVVPLKKAIAKSDILKKSLRVGAKDLLCTSGSTSGKGLEPRNPALKTDELLSINTSQDLSFLDPNTKMKLESNITHHFVIHKGRLPCASKAEYYSKAAMILEKLHHQDPGGIKVETVSSGRLRNPLFEHSSSEVKETQRAPPSAASHELSRYHPYQLQRSHSVQPRAFFFPVKPKESRTIRGTGKGILQSYTGPGMAKYVPWNQSEDVASEHPCFSVTTVGPEDKVLPSVAKQTYTLDVKEEPPYVWRVSLGINEIPNGQATDITLKGFESAEAKRSQGHLQTSNPQNSGDLALKIKEYNNIDLKSNEQPQSWPMSHHPHGPNTVHTAMVSLPSQNSLPNFQNGCQNPMTSQDLGDLMSVDNWEFRDHRDKIEAKNDNIFHPPEVTPILKSDISQGEMLEKVRPSIPSSTKLEDTAKTESQYSLNVIGKRNTPSKSSLKTISWNAAQNEDLCTKYKGQGDSLRNESPPQVTELQEVVDRENLIYNTAVELQSLINVLLQNLENNPDDPPKTTRNRLTKVQEYNVDSSRFQLGDSTYSSEGSYDPNHSRPARVRSGHASPEEHNHSIAVRIGDKAQSGVHPQSVCDQHLNKAKRGMGFDQYSTPMRNDHPSCYGRVGDKQESGLAEQRAGDAGQSGTETEMGSSSHGSPKAHNCSFKYTEIRDKHEPSVDHKDFDPHKNIKKGVGHGQLTSPREDIKDRGIGGQEQSSGTAQEASDPDEIRIKSGKERSPHRSPKMRKHSQRYREIRDKSHPIVNSQKVCDQHSKSLKKRMAFESLLTPKGYNYSCWHRVTGDKQQLGLADQRACDSDQSTRSEMGPYPHRSPKWHRHREIGEKTLSYVNAQRTRDQLSSSVKRRGFGHLPICKGNNHTHSYRVIENRQQSDIADQRAYDPGQIKKSRIAGYQHKCPEGYNFLLRYGILENYQEPDIDLRACDPHKNTKEGMRRGQPMSPKVIHSVKDRRSGSQDQSGVVAQGASDQRQTLPVVANM